jgi:hypothetical protein
LPGTARVGDELDFDAQQGRLVATNVAGGLAGRRTRVVHADQLLTRYGF